MARLHERILSGERMVAEFADRRTIQAMLDVEAALARVQVGLGLVPAEAAAAIGEACRAELYDVDMLAREGRANVTVAIPLVRALTERVRETDAEAARWVHWGATSQDIVDTGLVLQLRHATGLLLGELDRIIADTERLARAHADTVMLGRTLLQQATPVSFGLKAAHWHAMAKRCRRRLDQALEEAAVVQFGGAVGTLAALGDKGLAVADGLAAALDLKAPALSWHTQRDRLVALAGAVALAGGALGKIARDMALMEQGEVGEVSSPSAGGSSTMPHKRNPVAAVHALAAATRIPGLMAGLHAALVQEHERAVGAWQAEWPMLRDLYESAGGAAEAVAAALAELEVNAERMAENIERTGGLVLAEAVMMRLAPAIGRDRAHTLMKALTAEALETGRHLRDVLADNDEVTAHLSASDIAECLDPRRYLGATAALIERALSDDHA